MDFSSENKTNTADGLTNAQKLAKDAENPTKKTNLRLWRKGETGNPRGRPRKGSGNAAQVYKYRAMIDLKAAAREFSGEALETLVGVMRDKEINPQTRLMAANAILDRGHGKAVNQTEITVGVYDKMSDSELIKFITGETIDIAATPINSAPVAIESESDDD